MADPVPRVLLVVALVFVGVTSAASPPYVPSAPRVWDILAPFPYGYRELGADPVARWGGITAVPRANTSVYFPSELVFGGATTWSTATPDSDGTVSLGGSFNGTRWAFAAAPYGWPAQLWQGWALGDFDVVHAGTYLVQCVEHDFTQTFLAGKVWVDTPGRPSQLVNGDTCDYSFGRFPVTLEAGTHTLRIHVSGQGPSESFTCAFLAAPAPPAVPLAVLADDTTPVDVVDGLLAGVGVSFVLLNTDTQQWARGVAATLAVTQQPAIAAAGFTVNTPSRACVTPGQTAQSTLQQQRGEGFTLAPGQAMPVVCPLSQRHAVPTSGGTTPSLSLAFTVWVQGAPAMNTSVGLGHVTYGSPFAFTFLDVDGSLQYAAATPPANPCPASGCTVLLSTHGADVEAQSGAWTGAYQRQTTAWLLFPTGRRKLGFDWQGPGRINVFKALGALAAGIDTRWSAEHRADSTRIVFAGHSMGGHGCLNLGSHFPDLALGMACAAGWLDWEFYVPFHVWRVGNSGAGPVAKGMLEASIAEDDAGLYAGNVVGLPMIVRMGGNDTTVPPVNLLRFARLVDEHSGDVGGSAVGAVEVSEVPGEPHWWGGVVDDATMQAFFNRTLYAPLPEFPAVSSFTTLNPASSGRRSLLRVMQLVLPFRVGRVDVAHDSATAWTVATVNVARMDIAAGAGSSRVLPQSLTIDGTPVTIPSPQPPSSPVELCRNNVTHAWTVCSPLEPLYATGGRGPLQSGPARQVLEGPLCIVAGTVGGSANETAAHLQHAVWYANNLYMTGRYGAAVYRDVDLTLAAASSCNLVLLGGPRSNAWSARLQQQLPVEQTGAGFRAGTLGEFYGASVGAVFLAPWNGTRLALVIAGSDLDGFHKAALLSPTHTAQTTPDWVVTGPNFGWAGASGLLAGGFYSPWWEFDSRVSFVQASIAPMVRR